jgi:hypothetical protein
MSCYSNQLLIHYLPGFFYIRERSPSRIIKWTDLYTEARIDELRDRIENVQRSGNHAYPETVDINRAQSVLDKYSSNEYEKINGLCNP